MSDAPADAPALHPPRAAQKEHVAVWHGTELRDPWCWLRDKTSPEVLAYLEAENAYTEAQTPAVKMFGEALYGEFLGRIKQTDLGVPQRIGAFYYYGRTEEGKQYGIHCRRRARLDGSEDPTAPETVILDLNELASGHAYFGLGAFELSFDGDQLLYASDTTGFRQYSLYAKQLGDGLTSRVLAERVTSVEWMADGRHFVYTTEDPVTKRSNQVWRGCLDGTAPVLLLEETDELFRVSIGRTRDKAYLVCSAGSTDTWEARLLASFAIEGEFHLVLPREKGHKYEVDHRAGRLYLRSNRDAKNFRLVSAPLEAPAEWTELVPHRADTLLVGFDLYAGHLVLEEKREALGRLRILDFATGAWRELAFPESVYSISRLATPEWTAPAFRLNYQSMVTPSSVYDARLSDGNLELRKRTEVKGGYDPAAYITERRWATARDGVKIPLSLLYKKGTPLDGSAPGFQYGYGSYGLGMPASFSVARISLVDRGMVYVLAHIRGGDELGETWHDDGMLMKKMNTFFDFIDVAEWIVKEGLVARDRLVIEGGSAGGLLMGAVVNLRPDLWRAVHAAVPFVDVLNTMLDASLPLTVGEYLEWGDPNEAAAFAYMRRYSPYDNLAAKNYPAMLVTTSLNDSQVMYWEPAKYVARLRHLKTDENPLLLKCNMGAGHGGASGRYDRLKEVAFEYAWLMSQVGITR